MDFENNFMTEAKQKEVAKRRGHASHKENRNSGNVCFIIE